MKNKSSVRVSLTGGLGNQLFQLAFALNYAKDKNVILESGLGKPRLNSDNLPELVSFEMPSRVALNKKREFNWLSMKIAGFLLRQGIEKNQPKFLRLSTIVTKFLGTIILSISFREFVLPLVGQGVGFFQIKRDKPKNLLLGYFQSFQWASEPKVYNTLQMLKLKEDSQIIQKYRNLAITEKPLVVHFRLGDYKEEALFGIPSYSYYFEAVNFCWSTGRYNAIWAFSDEEKLARELFAGVFPREARWISEFNISAAATLEIMRLGHGYVIANSTFSWWGAFLSHNDNCQVVSPSPWFTGLEGPKDLIPSRWMMIEYNN